MQNNKRSIYRGDVFFSEFSHTTGSEIFGTHPIVVVQNNVGNYHSGTVIGVVLTSVNKKQTMPTHVILNEPGSVCNGSMAMTEQVFTIDKSRLHGYLGHLSAVSMEQINRALSKSFALNGEDAMMVCLCRKCLNTFMELPGRYLRRVDRFQLVKEPCTYCSTGMGFDYWIFTKQQRQPPMNKTQRSWQ